MAYTVSPSATKANATFDEFVYCLLWQKISHEVVSLGSSIFLWDFQISKIAGFEKLRVELIR